MDIISTDLGLIMSIFVATHFLKVHQKIAKLMLKNAISAWDGFPYQSPLDECLLISQRNKVFQLERVALLFFMNVLMY